MEKMNAELFLRRDYDKIHKLFDGDTNIKNTSKNTPKTFKWGDKEYLLDDLLKLHLDNENHYYSFAREKGQYDEESLQKLRLAIAIRIKAAKEGLAFEGDGSLSTDLVDNINIETRKKGLFRKAKYVDLDNTEWAKYYMHKLVSQLKPSKGAGGTKSDWDLSKYGLGSYLKGLGLVALDIFEKYDGYSGNTTRSISQRKELLKKHLQNYKNWIADKNFDFTKNSNEWDDNFEQDIENLLSNYDNLSDTEFTSLLRKLGAGESYVTAFTSKHWDTNSAQAQAQTLAQNLNQSLTDQTNTNANLQLLLADAWKLEETKRSNQFKQLLDRKTSQMTLYLGKDKDFTATDEDIQYFLSNTYLNGKSLKLVMDSFDAKYKDNPYNPQIAQIILPLKDKLGLLKQIAEGLYAGWNYDPQTINEERLSVLAFNKKTGAIEEIFLGNATEEWEAIKNKYLSSKQPNSSTTETSQKTPSAKNGGILYFQSGGDFSSYELVKQFMDNKTKEDAAKNNRTEEELKARDRIVSNGDSSFRSEQASIASPDAGFTAAEYTRLGTIAADITSMFLDPLSGAAVGATSSLANFGADVADDGFQMKDVGNLLVNLGFDAVGLIPVVGDAVGTTSKIVKQCVKLAPKVLTVLAGFQGVANFGGMTSSWTKLMSGDKEQKLTVQDWRNIAQSIGLLTGTVRGIKAHRSAKKMKLEAKVEDAIGVTITNKKTGKQELILVAGDQAAKIREAGNNTAEINKILDGIEQYKGKFGEKGELTVATQTGLQLPFGKTGVKENGKSSFGWKGFTKGGKPQVYDVYDFNQVQGAHGKGFRPVKQADAWRLQLAQRLGGVDASLLNRARQAKQVEVEQPSNKAPQYDEKVVKKYTDYIKASMQSRGAKRKTTAESIRSARNKVKLAEAYEQQSTEFKNNLNKIDADIQHHKNLRDVKHQELVDLKQRMDSPGAYTPQRIAQRNQLVAEINLLDKHLTTLNQLKILIQDNLNKHVDNPQDLALANKILNANITKAQSLSKKNHTIAYKRLLHYLNQLNNSSNTSQGGVKYDMKLILEAAGIKHAYKYGGEININKLNKFLNYARGYNNSI